MSYWQLFQIYYEWVCRIKSAGYRERMVRAFMRREWTDKQGTIEDFREWLKYKGRTHDEAQDVIKVFRYYSLWGD